MSRSMRGKSTVVETSENARLLSVATLSHLVARDAGTVAINKKPVLEPEDGLGRGTTSIARPVCPDHSGRPREAGIETR
jgi:hypothetical protein